MTPDRALLRLAAASALAAGLSGPAAGVEGEDPFHGPEPEAAPDATPEPEPEVRALAPSHADAAELAELIEAEAELLSEAGSATVDERTNTLVLRDRPARLERAEALVEELDHPADQVLIEAHIVLATGTYTRELGRRLGLSTVRGDGSASLVSHPGAADPGNATDGLIADLPEVDDGARLGVSVGEVGAELLELELSAMEAEGRGRVVSSPRVLTAEREEARIEQGVQIPYEETAESGATAVAFEDAALSLTATPAVTEPGRVALDLHVTKDAVGRVFDGVPSIDTQSVRTRLSGSDAETVVLGGVREQEAHRSDSSVPWLADLPVLGWLFQGRSQRQRAQELLVFVTPRIVTDADGVDEADAPPQIERPFPEGNSLEVTP